MSEREDDSDSAPEELTGEQGFLKNEEIDKVRSESVARYKREGKERRRKWAERKKTPKAVKVAEDVVTKTDLVEDQTQTGLSGSSDGMLPMNIVEALAAREKQTFSSDSEEEVKKRSSKKKRAKSSGQDLVILKEIPPPQCLANSMDFLKKRKMQVPRSSAVLDNGNQALRLLSTSGLLGGKS